MQEIRQQIGSAFRSPAEHVVFRVVTSEIDPEENFRPSSLHDGNQPKGR